MSSNVPKESVFMLPLQTLPHDAIQHLIKNHSYHSAESRVNNRGYYPDITEILEIFVQSIESIDSFWQVHEDIYSLVSTMLVNDHNDPTEELIDCFKRIHIRIKELFATETEYDNYITKGWHFNMAVLHDAGFSYDLYTGERKQEYLLSVTLYKMDSSYS